MPGQVRPNLKAAKIAYKILKTPKELQQNNQRYPTRKQIREWFRDSSAAQ
jgi:membrane-bound lytic murein transglycosylase